MSRLLFAAARGARLQVMADNNWYGITQIYMPFRRDARAIRIHPEDAHLQYGPISTELRKAAENIDDKRYLQDLLGYFGIAAIDDYLQRSDEFGYCWDRAMNATAIQKQLFLLILAESLAEEGL